MLVDSFLSSIGSIGFLQGLNYVLSSIGTLGSGFPLILQWNVTPIPSTIR